MRSLGLYFLVESRYLTGLTLLRTPPTSTLALPTAPLDLNLCLIGDPARLPLTTTPPANSPV